jgi:gluconokinase
MRVTRVLALDVGTSSARAQLFDDRAEPAGELVQEKYRGEDDPAVLVECVRRVLGGVDGDHDVAGASCFGHSLLALDREGRPLTEVLGWRDTRSADAAEWLMRRVDPDEVHARTGCPVHTSFWPAKLAWLAQEDPETFRSASRFVSFADYLFAQLLGRQVPASVSLASASGLLNLHTRAWDEELLEVLSVDADRLAPISDDAVEGWYPALLDGACSNLGTACTGHTRAALMIGTSGALRVLYETEQPQPRPGLFLYRVDEHRVVEGGALSDGGNLYHWLEDTLAEVEGSLIERGPDEHGLVFLALLGGERSPGWHQHMRGAVHGLSFATTPRDLRQAALEGVGFRFAEVADLLPELEEIVATGGALVRDEEWMQLLADTLARPVRASAVREASLRGAAVATVERLGKTAAEPELGAVFGPRADRADAYRLARERQRMLYESLT